MVAVGNNLDLAGAARQPGEGFGRIGLARLSVPPQVQDRAADTRRELEHVRTVLQGVDEARGARHVPPSRQEQQLAPPTLIAVSYTHLRAHETPEHLVCCLLLEKKKRREQGLSV